MKTRKQVIKDTVKAYIKNNKEDYKAFLGLIKHRRKGLGNKMLATFADKKGRAELSLPEKLWQVLDMSMDDPRFLITNEEVRWFGKTFPQFLIPYEF